MFGWGESPTNAITLLTADHRRVDELFVEFEREQDSARRIELATQICTELTVHALAEEELFYPSAIAALGEKGEDAELVWEATVEHGTLEGLIAALAGVREDDETFSAHMKVLKEYVKHHVREEENELFPKVRRTGLDLDELGVRIDARKLELQRNIRGAKREQSRGGGQGEARGNARGRGARGGSERSGGQRARNTRGGGREGGRAGRGG